jgi:hypothetical protein
MPRTGLHREHQQEITLGVEKPTEKTITNASTAKTKAMIWNTEWIVSASTIARKTKAPRLRLESRDAREQSAPRTAQCQG